MVQISAAHQYLSSDNLPFGTTISSVFRMEHDKGTAITSLVSTDSNAEISDIDTCELEPWEKLLKARIMNLIANNLHDQVIALVNKHMTRFSEMHAEGTLETLANALSTLEQNGFKYEVNRFVSLLSDSQLGMDIAFYNMGSNSPGTTDDTGAVRRLRHAIERHLETQRYKAPDHTVPFLGVSVNPK